MLGVVFVNTRQNWVILLRRSHSGRLLDPGTHLLYSMAVPSHKERQERSITFEKII